MVEIGDASKTHCSSPRSARSVPAQDVAHYAEKRAEGKGHNAAVEHPLLEDSDVALHVFVDGAAVRIIAGLVECDLGGGAFVEAPSLVKVTVSPTAISMSARS